MFGMVNLMPKEYIEREKLKTCLLEDLEECGEAASNFRPIAYGTILGLRGALSYVNTLPTADVIEPVRCSECIYSKGRNKIKDSVICTKYNAYKNIKGFCEAGERK